MTPRDILAELRACANTIVVDEWDMPLANLLERAAEEIGRLRKLEMAATDPDLVTLIKANAYTVKVSAAHTQWPDHVALCARRTAAIDRFLAAVGAGGATTDTEQRGADDELRRRQATDSRADG